MLQAIRSKATSFFVKILFALLIATFGIWGIGDIFQDRGPSTTVATVGGRDITAEQVNQEVQSQIEVMQKQLGSTIDAAQAKQLGLVDQSLQRLISSDLFDLEISRLGIAIGDETVRDAIVSTKAFQDPGGRFDPNIYSQVLAANHLTEPEFEADMRSNILHTQLVQALTDGMTAPKELVDTLYRTRNERRTADFVILPASAAGTIAAPTDAEVAAYYHAHADDFRAPERRTVTVATLLLGDVAAGIKVTDDELKQEYQNRLNEFNVPEQRHLEQLLFADEATAKKAEAELAAGKDFAAVAKDLTKDADPGSLDLGWVGKNDLPPELGDAAFALKDGGTTAPIKSTFGWHVLRLEGVKAPQTQTLDQVKAKLTTEVARDRAGDRIADLANQIDDALAGGGSFGDIVQKFGLKKTVLTDVDSNGKGPDGKPVAGPKPLGPIVQAAFATDSGQTSPLTDSGDNGYFVVHVDKVTPAAAKPLATVHDQAAKLWQADQQHAALQKLADAMAKDVDGGKSLKDVAAAHKLPVLTASALTRTGGDARVPPTLAAKLFDAKLKTAVTDASSANVMVAQLTAVEPADPAKDAAAVKQMDQSIGNVMQSDMVGEFDQGLRRAFPVKVDQASVDRLL